MNMTPFNSWYEAIKEKPNFLNILYGTLLKTNINIDLNISQMLVKLNDKTKRPVLYKNSQDYDPSLLQVINKLDLDNVPNKLAYTSLEDFKNDFTNPTLGEADILTSDNAMVLQLHDTNLPDIKYNIYLGIHESPMSFSEIMIPSTFDEEEFNIMGLAASTPQEFITGLDSTKTKISRIGKVVEADEYDVETLTKELFVRDYSLSRKHGNLKKFEVKEWVPNVKYVQIGKEISKSDTIIVLNHKFDTPITKDVNNIIFNTILYIPISLNIDEYLAEEKIKREIIKDKLIEILSLRIP